MSTIFIGGSRHVSLLPVEVKKRLDNVVTSGQKVFVGDTNGVNKAVQKYFVDRKYDRVTVYWCGESPTNNLGQWRTQRVEAPENENDSKLSATKDREMARGADFGLMIWDGKSPGTILTVLRLVQAGKTSVLFNVPAKEAVNILSSDQWKAFLAQCSAELRCDLKVLATPEERAFLENVAQPNFLNSLDAAATTAPTSRRPASGTKPTRPPFDDELGLLNRALADGDANTFMHTLGGIARELGMSKVSRETQLGLTLESRDRVFDGDRNPEFDKILDVLSAIGMPDDN